MEIVNIIYELARQHKNIAAFRYDRGAKKGAGNAAHPLVWLDDPIYIDGRDKTLGFSLNVDFLDIPKEDKQVAAIQGSALETALEFVEQIRESKRVKGKYAIEAFNLITLRDYYDDNAAGVRLSLHLERVNPVDLCSKNFDPEKSFTLPDVLPDFSTENPSGCAVFGGKGLPTFNV